MPREYLEIADPSASTTRESARSSRISNGVTRATQLVPVIISLCEVALRGPSIRQELENGAKDVKDLTRDYWTTSREENDRWAAEKQALLDEKAAGEGQEGWNGFEQEMFEK